MGCTVYYVITFRNETMKLSYLTWISKCNKRQCEIVCLIHTAPIAHLFLAALCQIYVTEPVHLGRR